MKIYGLSAALLFALAANAQPMKTPPRTLRNPPSYSFKNGFPTEDTLKKSADEIDFARAVSSYRFFYPSVSGMAIFKGNEKAGLVDNKVFAVLDTQPRHTILTANSDTPYGPLSINLSQGPMVLEVPAGPLIAMLMDVNQRWVADMGIPGPDAGKGGKHLILPPDYKGKVPEGYHVWTSTTNRLLGGARALPIGGDVPKAMELIKKIKVYPLNASAPLPIQWLDLTSKPQQTTAVPYEKSIEYWKTLHEVVNTEPLYPGYANFYGDLAALGIEKGKPFKPDAHMTRILESAAVVANDQMRVEAFADHRPDRIIWKDRKWEWVTLVPDNANFETAGYTDLHAKDKWFFQAIGASPAMFRRKAGQGSVYWLGLKDKNGNYVDGSKTYKLSMPLPVPAQLFWSVTIYDADTRSQINTGQGKAALRSLFEMKGAQGQTADMYFGPTAPVGHEGQWIKTIPGKGWFAYIRIYGPQENAFNGNWKPSDFEEVKTPLAQVKN